MQMESLAVAQVSVPSSINVPAKHIKTTGLLSLEQKGAVDSGLGIGANTRKRLIYNDSIFSRLESQTVDELIASYQQRSETTKYEFKKFVQYGSVSDASQPTSNYITFEMVIRIPKSQELVYVPPFWSVIKFAWIQYFCALVFWYYLLYVWFFGSLIRANVFNTVVRSDFKEERLTQNA
jgi:hypothetical protein